MNTRIKKKKGLIVKSRDKFGNLWIMSSPTSKNQNVLKIFKAKPKRKKKK